MILEDNNLPQYEYVNWGYDMYYRYSYGGGVFGESSEIELLDSYVLDNDAYFGGGFFGGFDTTFRARRSHFGGNDASAGAGAAIFGAGSLTNCLLTGNLSRGDGPLDGGAAMYLGGGDHLLENVTLQGNDGVSSLYLGSTASAALTNSILGENTLGSLIDGEPGGDLSALYSDVYNDGGATYGGFSDLTGTSGNISADPMFSSWSDDGDIENDDLTLQPGSPAIDAGDGSPDYNDADGSRNDMGAYGGPDGSWPR